MKLNYLINRRWKDNKQLEPKRKTVKNSSKKDYHFSFCFRFESLNERYFFNKNMIFQRARQKKKIHHLNHKKQIFYEKIRSLKNYKNLYQKKKNE